MNNYQLIACLVAMGAAPLSAVAQDLAVTAGRRAKVVLDNDKVRVIEVNMPPGTTIRTAIILVIAITGGMAVQTLADGSTRPLDTKAGEVRWSDPVTHDTKSMGKSAARTLVIELKDAKK